MNPYKIQSIWQQCWDWNWLSSEKKDTQSIIDGGCHSHSHSHRLTTDHKNKSKIMCWFVANYQVIFWVCGGGGKGLLKITGPAPNPHRTSVTVVVCWNMQTPFHRFSTAQLTMASPLTSWAWFLISSKAPSQKKASMWSFIAFNFIKLEVLRSLQPLIFDSLCSTLEASAVATGVLLRLLVANWC